jgi:hypothetical protein
MDSVDLLNELSKHATNVTFRAFKPTKNIRINNSTIMIFDTKKDHEMFVKNITFDLLSTVEKYYIIYYPKMIRKQIWVVKNMKYKNFNYLRNHNKTHLSLFTFTYFNKNKCNQTLIETINFFNKTEKMWTNNEDFFPNKFKNFNNCPLNFGRYSLNDRNTAALKNGRKFGREDYEMNEAIAKKLNIKSNYVNCPRNKTTRKNVCKKNSSEPEMYLKVTYIQDFNNSDENLVSFYFGNYAGFLLFSSEQFEFQLKITFTDKPGLLLR